MLLVRIVLCGRCLCNCIIMLLSCMLLGIGSGVCYLWYVWCVLVVVLVYVGCFGGLSVVSGVVILGMFDMIGRLVVYMWLSLFVF